MGKAAFHDGASGAPAQNKKFMDFLGIHTKGKPFGTSIPIMKSWGDAWHKEQRQSSNTELKKMGFGNRKNPLDTIDCPGCGARVKVMPGAQRGQCAACLSQLDISADDGVTENPDGYIEKASLKNRR